VVNAFCRGPELGDVAEGDILELPESEVRQHLATRRVVLAPTEPVA
jgi:hypothetical protein